MSRSSKWLFLKKFIAQPKINASITPSSAALARLMIKDIDWSHIDTIVEFGPGTGIFTEHIIAAMKPSTKFVLFEFDTDYCLLLAKQFGKQVTIINGNVQDFPSFVQEHQLHPDLIISGLPYFPFKGDQGLRLLQFIRSLLDQGCIMRGFSYSPWRFQKTYRLLHPILVDYTLSCVPPAFVYEMKRG